MNQMRNRLQALSLLDRALDALTDDELDALVASIPDDHREALDSLSDAPEGGFDDAATRNQALRDAAARGRMNGTLEQIATVLTDPCLAACITALGDASDNPSEEQLQEVLPALIEGHGVATVRLMFAASIAGEAAASVTLTRLLKHDEVVALPAAAPKPATAPVLVNEADPDVKARRKAAKERKQAEARARREQQAKARNRA